MKQGERNDLLCVRLKKVITDLPFKVSNQSIVIIKRIPVLQCGNCREFVIKDNVMAEIDRLLEKMDKEAELEAISYAV